MRVLLIDNSSAMRRIIAGALKRMGHHDIVEAANGREGLEQVSASGIDLAITDWTMPEMDGIEFTRAVRAMDTTRDLPVLMVTTNATRDHIVEAVNAGVSGYVVKPFTPYTLRQKIEMLVGHAEAP